MIPLEVPDTNQSDRIDLLDRQEFVDQIHNIALTLAHNKKSKCYAINGSWGVGKSFVLDMFEEQAQKYGQEGTVLDQYVIFRYNCWEYDYYEEPLIAIVAAILEQYEQKILFLEEGTKAELKETLVYIGKELLSIIRAGIKSVSGIDIKPAITATAEIIEAAEAQVEENHSYDALYAFKTALRKLQDTFRSLSDHQAIVVIVDELDRCLPEYTIKVLERLHHLFDSIPNVQVILSIDRSQLEHVVTQIYGQKTNVRRYLDKFIDFELTLPIGSLNNQADTYFDYYYSQFENLIGIISDIDLAEYKKFILEGIDARSRIAIMEKCNLLHGLLSKEDEKTDVVYMAIQIFLTILKFCEMDPKTAKENFSIGNLFEGDSICKPQNDSSNNYTLPGLATLRKKIKHPNTDGDPDFPGTYYFSIITYHNNSRPPRTSISCEDLWSILLAVFRAILGFEGDIWSYTHHNAPDLKRYALTFWNLLKTIS